MSEDRTVCILAAKRTPFGKFWGALKDISAPKLAAYVLAKILEDTKVAPELVSGVYMGEVLTAGVGQNPARQATLLAGFPNTCDARTFNKVCSSSLVAIDHAADKIMLGKAKLMLAGGMESMSRAPYLLKRWNKRSGNFNFYDLCQEWVKKGEREGNPDKYNAEVIDLSGQAIMERFTDSMIHDGLCDIYDANLPHMGEFADMCAKVQGISRDEQEEYSAQSHLRALGAIRDGLLGSQTVEIRLDEKSVFSNDEGPRVSDRDKMKMLKPAFSENGLVTAATSSQISDGAAVILLGSISTAEKLGLRPMARIVAFAVHSQEPEWYTIAPVGAIQKVLHEAGLRLRDIDLFEINEAFAVVPLHAMRELDIPHEKVNIWGGAVALGHPIGASGARITGNLVHQLIHTNGRYGIAVACNGGGEAVAVLIENM